MNQFFIQLNDDRQVKITPSQESIQSLEPSADVTIEELAVQGNNISAQIGGKGIAYVYFDLLVGQSAENWLCRVYREHLRAETEKAVGGMLRPVWQTNQVVCHSFQPLLRLLRSDDHVTLIAVRSRSYPQPDTETIWEAEGEYTAVGGRYSAVATLTFDNDGHLRKMLLSREGSRGNRLAEKMPRQGDRLLPTLPLLRQGKDGLWQAGKAHAEGLVIQTPALSWETINGVGNLYAALTVEDIHGRQVRTFAPLVV